METNLSTSQILGIEPTGEITKPTINLGRPLSEIARAIVLHLPADKHALYRKGDNYITVDVNHVTDKLGNHYDIVREKIMTHNRFRSWIEQHMYFSTGPEGKEKIVSLSKQMAEAILATDELERATPVIREICPVRMPIWGRDENGMPQITLAEPGYDPETGYYTVETVKYTTSGAEKFPPEIIRQCWQNIVGLFPWRDTRPFARNRDVAISLAVLIGQYCRNIIARLPMIIINGNQPSTGKSLLAWLLIAPVHGIPPSTFLPADENELGKMLNSMVLEGAPFIMLDDIGSLVSRAINNFTTSPTIKGRILGGNKTFEVENNCQLVATGNGLTTTPDIERRALILDLHYSGDATKRQIAKSLEKEQFNRIQWRSDMLSFCWYALNNWLRAGRPVLVEGSEKKSFEDFAKVIGSILRINGFASPFEQRATDGLGGDLLGRALVGLIVEAANRIQPANPQDPHTNLTHTYRIADLLDIADELGYTETITNTKDKAKSLGRRLANYRDREFTDTHGRLFAFGRGEIAASSIYTFIILAEPSTLNS